MNKIFVNNIGDLAEAPRASFYRFLMNGLSEELSTLPNPFFGKIKTTGKRKNSCLFYVYPNQLKLKGPQFTVHHCIRRDLTYAIQIYIRGEYSYYVNEKNKYLSNEKYKQIKFPKRKKIKTIRVTQDIFLGEIPLMTEEGSFIVTGCERIVISQIIRSPGIYFRKEFTLRKTLYTATIISNKGLWTKFILEQEKLTKEAKELLAKGLLTEPKDNIYIKLNDFKSKFRQSRKKEKDSDGNRLHIHNLIRFFGLTFEEISDSLKYPHYLDCLEMGYQEAQYYKGSVKEYEGYLISFERRPILDLEIPRLIQQLFFNQRSGCFSIGEIGRYRINKKLGLNLPKDITYLTAHDFIGIIDGLIELKYYDRTSDDIDHIKNKQIRSVGELLQNQIRIGLSRLRKNLIGQIAISNSQKLSFDLENSYDPEDWIVDPRPLTSSVKEFFKTSQLSQYMDQINPLSELTHKRKISVFGPNGLKRDHISTVIRDIHPSQYGRLCPIETSEGQNAGLIMSMSLYSRINSLGSLETPYFYMKDGKVFSEKRPIFLNPEQESEIKIAFGDVSLNRQKKITTEFVSIKDNYLFSVKKAEDINFLTTSPLQVVSLATALNCQGKVKHSCSKLIIIKDLFNQNISYYLRKYYRSNQETSLNQRPIVWNGENIFSGQIIADGPSTNDGELSLGRNLTIAYMPWEGYNYEDAIVINERLILEDCLTSVHIEEHETNLTFGIPDTPGSERLTRNLPHLTKYIRRHLNSHGIVKRGSYVKEHDILVGKFTRCEDDDSPEACEIIRIYIAQIRKIQIGDKLAGRHGNKGIISRILPRQDMPYLPDGTPIDILFNPLGVPSRMNVGQIFECLLGFAGEKLGKRFKISPFDEIYGEEASRILVNQKLKEASMTKNSSWMFNPYYPGKILLRDGRTGEFFDNPITVGKSYILKLIHLVEDKIHARATGPYSMITEQPLAGKSQKGGQRFGEMEVWAIEAYGCSNTLQELLTIKSDDIDGRNDMYESILGRENLEKPSPSLPESFTALIRELNSLGLQFSVKKFENGFLSTTDTKEIEKDFFQDLENRLKLRTIITKKKLEHFSKIVNNGEKFDFLELQKQNEKLNIVEKLKELKNKKN